MPIKLNGATNGSIELDVPAAVGSDLQVTLPATAGTAIVKATDGSVDLGSVDIDSSGNVGIGTTSPDTPLEVVRSSGGEVELARFRIEGQTNNPMLRFFSDESQKLLTIGTSGSVSGSQLAIDTSGGEAIRIDSSGRVGIGTTSMSSFSTYGNKLVVHGTGTDGPGITISSGTGDTASLFFADGTSGVETHRGSVAYAHSIDSLIFGTASTTRMEIFNNGIIRAAAIYTNATGSAVNVHVSSDGTLYRSTSSVKYKTDVETLGDSYADAILNCRPVWYRSTCTDDDPDHGFWGFIAEEVAEIDPRLVHFKTTEVTHDENGATVVTPCDPEPEGVAYERFVPHLLNLIKRQQTAIETLETKVAALEATP